MESWEDKVSYISLQTAVTHTRKQKVPLKGQFTQNDHLLTLVLLQTCRNFVLSSVEHKRKSLAGNVHYCYPFHNMNDDWCSKNYKKEL